MKRRNSGMHRSTSRFSVVIGQKEKHAVIGRRAILEMKMKENCLEEENGRWTTNHKGV